MPNHGSIPAPKRVVPVLFKNHLYSYLVFLQTTRAVLGFVLDTGDDYYRNTPLFTLLVVRVCRIVDTLSVA